MKVHQNGFLQGNKSSLLLLPFDHEYMYRSMVKKNSFQFKFWLKLYRKNHHLNINILKLFTEEENLSAIDLPLHQVLDLESFNMSNPRSILIKGMSLQFRIVSETHLQVNHNSKYINGSFLWWEKSKIQFCSCNDMRFLWLNNVYICAALKSH